MVAAILSIIGWIVSSGASGMTLIISLGGVVACLGIGLFTYAIFFNIIKRNM